MTTIELQIIEAIIERAKECGYELRCLGYDEDEQYDLKQVLLKLDDGYVTVHSSSGEQLGWLRLVFGNCGYDLVSDYTLSLAEFVAPIIELSSALEP